jgi:hypothetical protein
MDTNTRKLTIIYPPSSFSELLCELYFVQAQVQTQHVDRVGKALRSSLRLLSSESFLKDNGILVYEVLELFDDIEQGNAYKVKTVCMKEREIFIIKNQSIY